MRQLFNKYRERIFIGLAITCLVQLIVIIFLLSIDGSSKKIERLEIEKSISKDKIKNLESDLKTEKEISENYKQYYINANQRIYEYEQAFKLIQKNTNEKIKYLPRLSDAQLDKFFATQEREWRISQQAKSGGNRP
jgi:bacterioferritin (cytochrome b1)